MSPQGVLMNQAVRNVGSPDSGVNVVLRRRVVPPAKLSHSRITVSDLRRSLVRVSDALSCTVTTLSHLCSLHPMF